MTTPVPPSADALATAVAKFKALCAQEGMPPNTASDLVQVVSDIAVGLQGKIDAGIEIGLEAHPIEKALFQGLATKIVNDTISGFVDQLKADVAG